MTLPRRALPALLLAASALWTACEAGHRQTPGADNLLAGPEVLIRAPRPGQVVPADGPATRVDVLVDLRHAQGTFAGDRLWMALDAFPPIEVRSPGRTLPLDLPPGTHVLRAFATGEDGAPRWNAAATALRVFHVGGGDGRLASVDAEGAGEAFDEARDPALVWVSPLGPVARAGARLAVVLRPGRLADHRGEPPVLRMTIGGETHVLEAGRAVPLDALPPGLHHVVVEVLEHVPGRWGVDGAYRPVPGPLTRIERPIELH